MHYSDERTSCNCKQAKPYAGTQQNSPTFTRSDQCTSTARVATTPPMLNNYNSKGLAPISCSLNSSTVLTQTNKHLCPSPTSNRGSETSSNSTVGCEAASATKDHFVLQRNSTQASAVPNPLHNMYIARVLRAAGSGCPPLTLHRAASGSDGTLEHRSGASRQTMQLVMNDTHATCQRQAKKSCAGQKRGAVLPRTLASVQKTRSS